MEKTVLGSKTNDRRIANLRRLRARFIQQEELAKALDWTAPYVCQLIGPHPSRPISERTARKIERRLGLPEGALDAEPGTAKRNGAGAASSASNLVAPVMTALDEEIGRQRMELSRVQYRALVDHVHRDAVTRGGVDPDAVRGLVRLLRLFA